MKKFIPLHLLLSITIPGFATKAENQSSPAYNNEQQAQEATLNNPITFTADGINQFLEKTYNHPDYCQVLANNFVHLATCLQHGITTEQKHNYAKSVFRLFTNKLKESSWANAYAVEQLLIQMPALLQPYFATKHDMAWNAMHDMIYKDLYNSLEEKFTEFKKNPTEFLHDRSHAIITIIQKEAPTIKDEASAELRNSINKFIDLALNRLVWSPDYADEIWHSVKSISHSLSLLFEKNIIADLDDLDDMYWSLIHRFSFFLDIQGADLPLTFYENIRQDIDNNSLLLLDLEEQDELITTKKQYLRSAIKRAIRNAKKKSQ